MMYAMAMVAEREIPARQCTMTLQLDTLALSVGGQAPTHVFSEISAHNQQVFKVNEHFLEDDKGGGASGWMWYTCCHCEPESPRAEQGDIQ